MVYARKHMRAHKDIIPYLAEIVSKIDFSDTAEGFFAKSTDLPGVVGLCQCVETTEADVIYYAARPNRRWASRLVKNRKPEPTSTVTIIGFVSGGGIRIISGWFGAPAPKEEQDFSISSIEERQATTAFWSCHALILA